MSYPERLLNEGETVVVDLHPHWWHFAKPAGALIASIILGGLVLGLLDGDAQDVVGVIMIVVILASAVWLLSSFISWISTNFVVTDQRVIFRTGVFAKSGIEIPLDRVNTVHFSQGVLERILGAGDLLIESAGTDGQQRFTDIRNPDKVQQQIHAQGEMREQRRYTGSQGAVSDVATQLEKLEGMLERGTLSQQEFDDQKRKLLGD